MGLQTDGLPGRERPSAQHGSANYSQGRVFIYTREVRGSKTGKGRLGLQLALARAGGMNEQSQNAGLLRNAAPRLQLPAGSRSHHHEIGRASCRERVQITTVP